MTKPISRLRGRFVIPVTLVLCSIYLGILIIESQTTGLHSAASPSAINLVDLPWFARQGFSDEYRVGFNTHDPGVKEITRFPIWLNKIFNIPPGDPIHEYTLMTSFELSPEGAKQALIFSLAEFGENWAIYLNGKEIRREIYLDSKGRMILHRTLLRVLIPIPPDTLHPGSNILVFRILGDAPATSIFSGWMPGFSMSNNYQIDLAEKLIRQWAAAGTIFWLQIGIYFFSAVLQFLFFLREKEKYSLYLGFYLLTCIVYSYIYSGLAYEHIHDTALIIRLMYISNLCWPVLIALTVWNYLYTGKSISRGIRWLIAVAMIEIVSILVSPIPWVDTIMFVALFTLGASAVYIFSLVIQAVRRKVPDAKKLLTAGIFIVMLVIYAILDMLIIRSSLDLTSWMALFLAIAFSMIITDRFWRLANELTETNRQLTLAGENMEKEVILRTTELRKTNARLEEKLIEINSLQADLRDLATHDPLTGLFNRRFLDEIMDQEFSRAKRKKYCLCLVMVDIDHFKILNDTYGHKAGDEILKTLSNILTSHIRRGDYAFRYGGEEFLILLSDSHQGDATQRLDQLRLMVEQNGFLYEGKELHITISAGVAEFSGGSPTPDAVLTRADSALYIAKAHGRNRVESA